MVWPNAQAAGPTQVEGVATSPLLPCAMASSARYNALRAALGPGELERIRHARILVVGAGGIGCELLKDLVLVGVGHVDIVRRTTADPDRPGYH